MKRNDIQELKNKSKEELTKNLQELRVKVRDLKVDVMYGKEKNVKSIKNVKKTIARIQTFLNAK